MQSYDLQAFEIVATTAVERRHSNRSNPAGLEHRKKSHPSDDSFFYLFESTRRDSNSPIIEKANKIKEECTLSTVCLQAVYNITLARKAVKGSAKQIHFTPLLLVVELLQSHHIRKRLIEQFLSINLLIIIYLFFKYYNLYRLGGRRLLSSSYLISSVSPLL